MLITYCGLPSVDNYRSEKRVHVKQNFSERSVENQARSFSALRSSTSASEQIRETMSLAVSSV